MYEQVDKPKIGSKQSVASQVSKKSNSYSVLQMRDNRSSFIEQRDQQLTVNPINSIMQREKIEAVVNGLTHLVRANNGSIFEGEEVMEVTDGTPIELESSDKIRSRRGPNQEYNRATDLSGQPIYRWVRVLQVNHQAVAENIYIRDDTVMTGKDQPFGPRPSVISPEHRERDDRVPEQNVTLVGTTHDSETDLSGRVNERGLEQADLILEHATHRGRDDFIEDSSVSKHDLTQKNLMDRARMMGPGTRVIGADGRKLVDEDGLLHAISTKFKGHSFEMAEHVTESLLTGLVREFIALSVGLEDGNIQAVIQQIAGLGTYTAVSTPQGSAPVPDISAVLANDYKRVHTITQYFKPEVKRALAANVLQQYQLDLAKEMQSVKEQLEQLDAIDSLTVDVKKSYAVDIHRLANEEIIGHLRNAISNMTLLAEALGSNKRNLVVAFGAEHIPALENLLRDVDGVHKRYNIKE